MSVESPGVDGGQPCFADRPRRTDHRAPAAGGPRAPRDPGRAGERDRGGREGPADEQWPAELASVEIVLVEQEDALVAAVALERSAGQDPDRDDATLSADRRRHPERGCRLGEARGQPLLEPERWVDPNEIAAELVGRIAQDRVQERVDRSDRRAAGGAVEDALEIAIGQERLDFRTLTFEQGHL